MLYDSNHITIDGSTNLAFTEDVCKRYEAYGWHTQSVETGDSDLNAIDEAIKAAKAVIDKPSLIKVTTTIGYGSTLAGTASVHGSPLGADSLAKLKVQFGYWLASNLTYSRRFKADEFFSVPEEVAKALDHTQKGKDTEDAWNALFAKYAEQFPAEAAELKV